MQTQNINLCLTIERAIAPTLLKSLNSLLQQVLEQGLDADAKKGSSKEKKIF
jgi:hypothetical protein